MTFSALTVKIAGVTLKHVIKTEEKVRLWKSCGRESTSKTDVFVFCKCVSKKPSRRGCIYRL